AVTGACGDSALAADLERSGAAVLLVGIGGFGAHRRRVAPIVAAIIAAGAWVAIVAPVVPGGAGGRFEGPASGREAGGLEHDRAMTARIGAPDDDVALADVDGSDRRQVAEQRSRPAVAAVAVAVRIGRAGEVVAEGDEAGAVSRQRQAPFQRDRPDLAVVDLGLVLDAPPGRSDDLLPEGRH